MPRERQQPTRRYASVETVAEIYDVNPRTVRRWISEGRITGYKIGAVLVKVDLNEVEEKMVRAIPAVELPPGRTRVWALMTGASSLPAESTPPAASPAPPAGRPVRHMRAKQPGIGAGPPRSAAHRR